MFSLFSELNSRTYLNQTLLFQRCLIFSINLLNARFSELNNDNKSHSINEKAILFKNIIKIPEPNAEQYGIASSLIECPRTLLVISQRYQQELNKYRTYKIKVNTQFF